MIWYEEGSKKLDIEQFLKNNKQIIENVKKIAV